LYSINYTYIPKRYIHIIHDFLLFSFYQYVIELYKTKTSLH
jgi:hypothetical protein